MKVMFLGFLAVIGVSVIAWYALGEMGFSSAETYSGPSVRLD